MSDPLRDQLLRFEVQHIFARDIATSGIKEVACAKTFSDSSGFSGDE